MTSNNRRDGRVAASSTGSPEVTTPSSGSTVTASPLSPAAARHRPSYARLPSVSESDNAYRHFADEDVAQRNIGETSNARSSNQGLGLSQDARRVTDRRTPGRPFPRGPVDSSTYSPLANNADTSFSTIIGTPNSSFAEHEDDAQAYNKTLPTESSTSINSHRPYATSRDDERLLRQSNLSSRSYAGTRREDLLLALTDEK